MQKNRAPFGIVLVALVLTVSVITMARVSHGAMDLQETKANQNLVREVRHQLLLLPYYTVFDNLAFKVDGDRVTLEGQVTNPTLKHDAEAAVKSIEGVSSVTSCGGRSIAPFMATQASPSMDGLRCLRFT